MKPFQFLLGAVFTKIYMGIQSATVESFKKKPFQCFWENNFVWKLIKNTKRTKASTLNLKAFKCTTVWSENLRGGSWKTNIVFWMKKSHITVKFLFMSREKDNETVFCLFFKYNIEKPLKCRNKNLPWFFKSFLRGSENDWYIFILVILC